MATARAIANGNWSSTSTWNGGVLPGNGDTVYANGFNVTINQDINIGGANNPTVNAGSFVAGQWYSITFVGTTNFTLIGAASNTVGTVFLATGVGSGTGQAQALATLTTTNNASAGASAGGGFTMSTVYAMTCDIRAGTTTCLNLTATSGTLALTNLRIIGGTTNGAHGINAAVGSLWSASGCIFIGGNNGYALNNNSTGNCSLNGICILTGGLNPSNNGHALFNNSTGTILVSASCTFTGGSTNGNNYALVNNSTGTISITASCTFTGGNSGTSNVALVNNSTGTISITESCTFTAGQNTGAAAINNASSGTVIVINGTFTASAFANAVTSSNTSADVRLSGIFLDHWSGWTAVYCPKFRLGTTPAAARHQMALAGTTDSYVNFYTADNSGFGLPAANNVRAGVSYGGGNLTGTCAVPAAASVAYGVPVDNTTGTAVLTVAAIRSGLSVELGRIDASVSSRLAPSDTLARVTLVDTTTNLTNALTASAVADAVWDELLADHTTHNTFGARVVRSLNSNNELQITGSHHAAADIHEFQPQVITDDAFAPSTITMFMDATRAEFAGEITELEEVHLIHGLKSGSAMTVTPTSRVAGAVSQTISGDGSTTTTVTRD